ncbi:MAG: xanthine dehydrogenase family protein molybdopterin-binding subunit [Acidimicrobiales bacterium]
MSTALGARNVGASVRRVEDPRILTGRGRYVDDVSLPGMLHAAFLRSVMPHGRLLGVDVSEARALPGVVAVYTGADLLQWAKPARAGAFLGVDNLPGLRSPEYGALATDKVRFVGDPIALVVAESRYLAEDGCELIVEDYEALDPIVTYEDALNPALAPLFDELGDNVAFTSEFGVGDIDAAFAKADRIVEATVSVHRHQNVPMEGRGTIASWDPTDERLTIYTSTQSPHLFRLLLPSRVDIPMDRIRVLAADVGGAFGLKTGLFREDVALVAASRALGRPVKWIEDRSEHMSSSGQAREEMADLQAAVTNDGVLLGVKMDVKLNTGAYPSDPFPGAMMVSAVSALFQGPLKIEALAATSTAVFSNKASYVAYRGPWATADFLRERLLDITGRELGIDPLEIRRRNYVVRGEPPLAMLTGQPFAGITTRETLDQAAAIVGWSEFRERQRTARESGRYLGIGIASYLEAAPGPRNPDGSGAGASIMGDQVTHVSVAEDGRIEVITQQQPHGQGHETTLAQVAADELGVAIEDVRVLYGDTDITPVALIATGGSRAATMANGAVLHASRQLRAQVLDLAAHMLEASPNDLQIAAGVVAVKGSPSITVSFAELARVAQQDEPGRLPEGAADQLRVTRTFDGGMGGWSGGTHCCIVDVDVETGLVRIDRYIVVEDCGVPVNPAIVEGQIRGGVAQAIGAVLLEHSAYSDEGQFLASTFMDYLLPTTTVVPPLEIHHVETIALDPDVNFRGVGEGGMIVAPAAIVNAIDDALSPFGARIREQHLPPCRILELIGPSSSGD